ncbi:glycosyltransferase family 39 protein [Flavobacterium orientale]|uniref:Glycosyltransferase RgtA/B/C/D-like domain-containing protein n=1 Tax=Flavobacterium orientale TaxID=1756020 RepID=A0A916XZ94_9FLAO|nr:glycosyltransferase family 39 protein [Flavobacterium orientale]GGD22667.1 hypothetical protein GCM10011343_11070 [Flavobacterium orientale]
MKKFFQDNYILVAILFIATILRLFHLNFQSLWLDEIFTLSISNPELTSQEFFDEMHLREGFPYLYFYILKVFYFIFGYSEWTARLVSALAGVGGVYAIYLMGKELINKNTGLIAALLVAFNEYHIFISQDARPYTLYFFTVILSFYSLVLFLKNQNLKNALLYGLFTALLLNTNFFGLLNVFTQMCIILFYFTIVNRSEKINLLKNSLIAGVIALLLFLPNYKLFLKLFGLKSFWVPAPQPDTISNLLIEFLGNFEVTRFIFLMLFIYYIITVFNDKSEFRFSKIKENKQHFSFVLFFGWFGIFSAFLLIKSYTDISLMLPRYFVSITPVLFLVLAIPIDRIKNKMVRFTIVLSIITLCLINLFVIKEHYTKVSKTQFREITQEILNKNEKNDKIVSNWAWLFNYYFKLTTQKNTIESSLEVYVQNMMNGKVDNGSFWYVDANQRPYGISPNLENYLNENFIVKENLEYFDTWAKYYVSKNQNNSFLNLNNFKPSLFDGSGAMVFVENMTSSYPVFTLEKGNYIITINGVSLPAEPLNNENAHFKFLINNKIINDFYLDNNLSNKGVSFSYKQEENSRVKVAIEFDNDAFVDGIDRNAIIHSIKIEKSN